MMRREELRLITACTYLKLLTLGRFINHYQLVFFYFGIFHVTFVHGLLQGYGLVPLLIVRMFYKDCKACGCWFNMKTIA
jgi:hypothetical protein